MQFARCRLHLFWKKIMSDNNGNRKKDIIQMVCVLAVIAVLVFSGIYRCPFDFFLGIPCPMCGMTRAIFALFHGDVSGAFNLHPLWPLVPAVLILYVLYLVGIIRVSAKAVNVFLYVLAAIIIICFIIRHIMGSPVVAIHTDTSVIGKIIKLVFQGGIV